MKLALNFAKACILIMCICAFAKKMYDCFDSWHRKETGTKIDVRRIQELRFPCLSLCQGLGNLHHPLAGNDSLAREFDLTPAEVTSSYGYRRYA